MKKLIATELIKNRLEVLVDVRGKTQFILARRREEEYNDTYWQLFQGDTLLGSSPYRHDLYGDLNPKGYAVISRA